MFQSTGNPFGPQIGIERVTLQRLTIGLRRWLARPGELQGGQERLTLQRECIGCPEVLRLREDALGDHPQQKKPRTPALGCHALDHTYSERLPAVHITDFLNPLYRERLKRFDRCPSPRLAIARCGP